LLAAAAAVVTTFYPDALDALKRRARAAMALDAVAALVAAIGLSAAVHQLQGLLVNRFHAHAIFSVGGPDAIEGAAPAVAAIASAAYGMLTDAALLGLLALLVQRVKNWWMRIALVVAGVCSLVPGDVRTAGELGLELVLAVMLAGAIAAFCWGFARRNYVAYALVLWVAALRGPANAMLGTGNASLAMQGWLVVAAMAAAVVWVLGAAAMPHPPNART
jgi:hypothetical protein